MGYIGRFAPSPSGSLHFGSLVAALASFLQAKSNAGLWYLRIDDVDSLRVVKNASSKIISALEAHHLFWDSEVTYQSHNIRQYQKTLDLLYQHTFGCICTRKQLKPKPVYQGQCRNKYYDMANSVVRCHVGNTKVQFTDVCQGAKLFDLQKQIGDFILQRRDGIFSYQLATVVDDINMKVSEIIRGVDLLEQTPKQIFLYQLLN